MPNLTSTPEAAEQIADCFEQMLAEACVASCTCCTKTPAPEFHAHDCKYRILRAALDVLQPKDWTKLRNRVWNQALEAAAARADELCICSHEYREDVAEEIRALKA